MLTITVPKAPKYAFTTLDQLVYAKHKGVMSLATFLAVDKAYQAKEKEEQLQVCFNIISGFQPLEHNKR